MPELPKEEKENKEDISEPLTKKSHRDPEKHLRGDTLPDSLLEYQEGSGSLYPDVAGNNPVMLRQKFTVRGDGTVQNSTTSLVQVANLVQVITCPIQAGSNAFVKVSFSTLVQAVRVGGGTNGNVHLVQLFADGVAQFALLHLDVSSIFLPYIAGTYFNESQNWHEIDIPIVAGQTITFDVRQQQSQPTTPTVNYSTVNDDRVSNLNCKLYY